LNNVQTLQQAINMQTS